MKVYLDNAATTPLAKEVLDEMLPYLTEKFGNPSSIHSYGRTARAAVEKARKTVSKYLNASTAEIFFTGSGTESNNTVIKRVVEDLGVTRIITSPIEHHCVLHASEAMHRKGIALELVAIDNLGHIDLNDLEAKLADGTQKTLVTLMHANNEIGTIADLVAIGNLCNKYNAYFHSDTVQTIGYFPFDLQQLPVHFISGSAHKFHGPKGVGFLYIRTGITLKPFIDGGSQERNMRAGTENVSGIVGLGKALEIAHEEMDKKHHEISSLKKYMIERLTETIPGVSFNGDTSENKSNYKVLNVLFPEHEKAELLLFNLDMAGIAASGGSACTSGSEKGSHVLEGIKADPNRKAVRFSFSKYNTRQEIDFVIETLQRLFAPLVKSETAIA